MTTPSHSQPHQSQEHSHSQNPNFAQDEQNQLSPPQPTLPSPQPPTQESPNPQNQDDPPPQSALYYPQQQQQQQQNKQQDDSQLADQEDQDDHQLEQSGTSLSPSPPIVPPIPDPHVAISDLNPPSLTSPTNPHRRHNKRKKGGRNIKKQQAIEKKLQTLTENLKPIPFVPSKTLDFAKHEKLLKSLGLWDFVHIEFDKVIREDLIAQLIATYDPKMRCSYVNEIRIAVNRADLGRAFKLPVKKEKGGALEGVDLDSEALSEESISFIGDFVSNWVLLHEDTWMMPSEVLNWTRAIKDGHPQKVDWAGLIWFMVEKELTQGEQLGDCYYAPHLQYLIKSQREAVLREEPKVELEVEVEEPKVELEVEVEVEEPKVEVEVVVKEENDGGDGQGEVKMAVDDDVKICGLDDSQGQDNVVTEDPNIDSRGQDNVVLEEPSIDSQGQDNVVPDKPNIDFPGGQENVVPDEQNNDSRVQDNVELKEANIELTLGQDAVEKEEVKDEEMMDVEECKEEQRQWLLDGKNSVGGHFLQHCNLEDGGGSDSQEGRKQEDEEGDEEPEEEEQDDGFNISPNDDTLEGDGLTGNLLSGMETTQIPFSSQGQLRDQSSIELLASRVETHAMSGGPSIFPNGAKRDIGHEHDISHPFLNGSNKRLKIDGPWDHKGSDSGMCMEQAQQLMDQAQQWMAKARVVYEAKDQACDELNMNQQFLLSELQRRESLMEHMQRTRVEELQKKDGEIFRLERELYMMGNILEGYRKALKETNKAFAEYRQRCQLPEEPLYKDAGPGGLVLSITELRQKQEEEDRLNRLMIEQKFKEAEEEYIGKFEVYVDDVQMLNDKLMNFENEIKLLKELFAKLKTSEISASAANE